MMNEATTEEVVNRWAAAAARRVARTGESFESAVEAVVRDFCREWPTVAAAMVNR